MTALNFACRLQPCYALQVGLSHALVTKTHVVNSVMRGTWSWAAPETITGLRCTEKVDIWSFGIGEFLPYISQLVTAYAVVAETHSLHGTPAVTALQIFGMQEVMHFAFMMRQQRVCYGSWYGSLS